MHKIIPIHSATSVQVSTVQGASGLSVLPPLSVYIHVPWCVRKCPYCDFNSHASPTTIPEADYLQALEADLIRHLPLIWGRRVVSVFIGGGTPSLLSADSIDRVLTLLRSHLNLIPDAEITLEANPGAVEAERFASYAQSGVNRISLGIQSFNDHALLALGRIHNGREAMAAIEIAQRCVARVNLDLMFALPHQTLGDCEHDVRTALSFGTEHLSLYHLTLEPNTVFAKYPPSDLPDDDTAFAMQDLISEHLAQAGYEHYEISAYAKPGAYAQHNLNYWEFGDYLGLGPGAHGKISFHDRIVRTQNLKQPDSWMQAMKTAAPPDLLTIAVEDLAFEFMLNALRLTRGVPLAYYTERTGLPLTSIQSQLQTAMQRGLLHTQLGRLQATELGQRFLNDLQTIFLNDDA